MLARAILFAFFLLIGLPAVHSQVEVDNKTVFDSYAIPQRNKIPVKIINNQILLPLKFHNGMVLNFLLDTGASIPIIIDPLPHSLLGTEPFREIRINGYGREEPLIGTVCKNFSFTVNDFYEFNELNAVMLNESLPLTSYLGEPIYGIIGYDFFKDYRVEINYGGSYIKLVSNKKPFKKKRYKEIDLEMVSNKPYIRSRIQDGELEDSLHLLVDTGFSGAVSLYPKDKNQVFIQAPYIDNYRGRGINGLITSTFKKMDVVEISDYELRNVSTNFLDSVSLVNFSNTSFSDGSIGTDLLKRFQIVFDYSRKKMYLKKNSRYRDKFRYNIAGLRIKTKDWQLDTLIVEDVRPLSASHKAGIQANDILLKVNDRQVKNLSFERIYTLLNDVEQRSTKVTVKRDEEILTFELFLQDIF